MPHYDFRTPRLFVDHPLCGRRQTRRSTARRPTTSAMCCGSTPGDPVLVFNGRDGEWRATLADGGKRALLLVVAEQSRAQTRPLDLHYWFAPLKHARLDYMVQKAVEMGVSLLQPVITRHAQVARRQSRAHARQRDRGGRAVRHPHAAGDRAPGRFRAPTGGARSSAAAGVLRRGRRAQRPGRGARGGAARGRAGRAAASPSWSARKAALRTTSARPSPGCPTSSGSRSARASCAPIRRRWRHWRWSKACSATGAEPHRSNQPGFVNPFVPHCHRNADGAVLKRRGRPLYTCITSR